MTIEEYQTDMLVEYVGRVTRYRGLIGKTLYAWKQGYTINNDPSYYWVRVALQSQPPKNVTFRLKSVRKYVRPKTIWDELL